MDKIQIVSIIGVIGGFISDCFGGWTDAMTTLCIFMLIDYLTGIICAGVFKNSSKTKDGGLESKSGYIGLMKKFGILILVLVGCRLDLILGTEFIKDSIIIAFITNETISITENIGLMGVPLPEAITKAITLLNENSKKGE